MNRKVLVVTAIVLAGVAIYLNIPGSSSGKKHQTQNYAKQGVITQKVVKETTIIKEPKVVKIAPIPELTVQDRQYLAKLQQEEDLSHQVTLEELKAQKAKSLADQAKSNASAGGNELDGITGGAKPAAATQMAVTGVVEDKHTSEDDDFLRDAAFAGIQVVSISKPDDGPANAYLRIGGGLQPVIAGTQFGDFKVNSIDADSITLTYLKKGYRKKFSVTSINFEPRVKAEDKESETEESLPPISVQRIKARYGKD